MEYVLVHFRVRMLLAALLFSSVAGAGIAFANGSSLVAISTNSLLPSETPGMLGPITAEGRVGWACQPERAAGARQVHDAELPTVTTK